MGTFFTDPIFFGKILSIATYGITGVSFFYLGKSLRDAELGIILFALFVFNPVHFSQTVGGHGRSFSYFFLAIMLRDVIDGEFKRASWVTILILFE